MFISILSNARVASASEGNVLYHITDTLATPSAYVLPKRQKWLLLGVEDPALICPSNDSPNADLFLLSVSRPILFCPVFRSVSPLEFWELSFPTWQSSVTQWSGHADAENNNKITHWRGEKCKALPKGHPWHTTSKIWSNQTRRSKFEYEFKGSRITT